jgi:outer membrane protein
MLNSRRGGLLAAVCSAGLICGLAAGPVAAETLADAIALAYDSNPTLQAQRAQQRALDENYVQARAGYRPQVSLSAQGNYQEIRTPGASGYVDTNNDGIPDTFATNSIAEGNSANAGISISQPVYTGGRVGAAISAAEADILTGRENLRRVETQVLGQVMTAYVDTRRDQEALRIRQEDLQVLQRQLEESKARFEVGEITRTDVAQSEARLAASQAALQSAQAQLAISRANYAAAVGQNPGDLAPEPSLAPLLPAGIDPAFDIATRDNGQIRAAEYAEKASRARLAAARAERMPNVSLRATLAYGGQADPLDTDTWSRNFTGTAVVSVPLFTGGLTNSRVRAAIERNNSDRIGIETARRAVMQSLTQSWSQLIAARANIGSTDQQVQASKIAAEGTRQEQQVGLRTTLDVLNAEQELRAAELSQVAARHDEYIAAASVLSQMGWLETKYLTPAISHYDPKANFRKVRMTWGWVPWEEPIAIVDSAFTPKTKEKPDTTPPPAAIVPAPAPAAK